MVGDIAVLSLLGPRGKREGKGEREGEGRQALDKTGDLNESGQRPKVSAKKIFLISLLPPCLVCSLLWDSNNLPQTF